MRRHRMDADAIDYLINNESGLLGVSGTSADMRVLLASRRDDPRADRAIQMFCGSVRKAIGALTTTMGGIDQLVFTGGIGERSAAVRGEVCAGLEHLGLALDQTRNLAGAPDIAASDSRCWVRIVAADENRMIARHTSAVLHLDLAMPAFAGTDPRRDSSHRRERT